MATGSLDLSRSIVCLLFSSFPCVRRHIFVAAASCGSTFTAHRMGSMIYVIPVPYVQYRTKYRYGTGTRRNGRNAQAELLFSYVGPGTLRQLAFVFTHWASSRVVLTVAPVYIRTVHGGKGLCNSTYW